MGGSTDAGAATGGVGGGAINPAGEGLATIGGTSGLALGAAVATDSLGGNGTGACGAASGLGLGACCFNSEVTSNVGEVGSEVGYVPAAGDALVSLTVKDGAVLAEN